jgi:3-oxoacyl-[acyl-carrier-protein] synthase II
LEVGTDQKKESLHRSPKRQQPGATRGGWLIGSDAVQFLIAHATSTELGDLAEVTAIRSPFGPDAGRLSASCTKSLIGYLCGASGSVAAAVLAMTIRHGVINPTINCENSDPACAFDIVPQSPRNANVKVVMLNSFGFGGQNSSLVMSEL